MSWNLIFNKETECRKPYNCADCDKKYPIGAYVKNYTFKKGEAYKTKKICEDCEKYYRRADPKME